MEPNPEDRDKLESLAAYRHCSERICAAWPGFLARRAARLEPHPLLGNAPEKITETILEDLFTSVLDWPLGGFNPQVDHGDIVLSSLGIRWLIIEAKYPGTLAWNRDAVEWALDQETRYAADQRVQCVAVSDGVMLYAADLEDGGKRDCMSGSPIVAGDGSAIGIMTLGCTSGLGQVRRQERSGPHPALCKHLPGWLLTGLS